MTDREIMQQALEALEQVAGAMPFPVAQQVITALRERLAREEQEQAEPVALHDQTEMAEARRIAREYAWPHSNVDAGNLYWALHVCLRRIDAATPRREWRWLTDEEKAELDAEHGDDTLAHLDAIEAKLREKNA